MKLKMLLTMVAVVVFVFRANADEFRVLDFGHITMPIATPWMRIINNQSDWDNFYNDLLSRNGLDPVSDCSSDPSSYAPCSPTPPKVDFTAYQVVTGGLGLSYTPTSDIVIASVTSTASAQDPILINVLELAPSQRCVPSAVIGIRYPMATVVVPKIEGKAVHVVVEQASLICSKE
ncbi:MAG: hypothetical protein ABW098_07670 [Candidatus Thiodiazotropha sp.]